MSFNKGDYVICRVSINHSNLHNRINRCGVVINYDQKNILGLDEYLVRFDNEEFWVYKDNIKLDISKNRQEKLNQLGI